MSPREEQEGLEFPLAKDWSRRCPVEAQTLHVPKADRSRDTRRGAVAGAVEGRQTHLQGAAGQEVGALPASSRGRRQNVG